MGGMEGAEDECKHLYFCKIVFFGPSANFYF